MSPHANPNVILELLSEERMSWYRQRPNETYPVSDAETLSRYEQHLRDQAQLWGLISGVEVVLRNAMHRELCNAFGDKWYTNPSLRTTLQRYEIGRIDDAVASCEENRRRRSATRQGPVTAITTGHVVAALSFGFWRKLLSRTYDRELWVPCLHHAFVKGTKRPQLYEAADRMNTARNRIAHHERADSSKKVRRDGVFLAGAVSPAAGEWVDSLL